MKLALSKRTKFLFFLGIPLTLLLAASLYLALSGNALQADFDKIEGGTPLAEVRQNLGREFDLESTCGVDGYPSGSFICVIKDPDSFLVPGSKIRLRVEKGKVLGKVIHHPDMNEIVKHWKRQLGL